jgi:hypothetical protein
VKRGPRNTGVDGRGRGSFKGKLLRGRGEGGNIFRKTMTYWNYWRASLMEAFLLGYCSWNLESP